MHKRDASISTYQNLTKQNKYKKVTKPKHQDKSYKYEKPKPNKHTEKGFYNNYSKINQY